MLKTSLKLATAIAAASAGSAFAVCPAGTIDFGASAVAGFDRECIISGVILSPLTLNSTDLFILEGKVEVGNAITSAETAVGSKRFIINEIDTSDANATTLTIPAGATVIGDNGSGAAVDYLVVNRGSDIFINGTAAEPVRMTSRQDIAGLATSAAQWGGLYLNGYGLTNECDQDLIGGAAPVGDCERAGEADTGRYGGANNSDSSGSISYLTVAYAGNAFDPATDLNGIAFQAVGDGTAVSHIQVHQNFDDGVEFYGGAVDVTNVVLTDNGDDSFDSTGGWQGSAQFVIITQTPTTDALLGDRFFESDNNKSPNNAAPETNASVSNVTMINTDAKDKDGIKVRRGSNLTIANAVMSKADGACFDITDGDGNGNLNAPLISILADCTEYTDSATTDTWVDTNNAGEVTRGATSLNGYINGPAEATASFGAVDPSTLDAAFTSVDFIGAVKDCDSDWAAGWTVAGTLPTVDPASCDVTAQANVPAMGWAGLIALFGGLAGVARYVRRVA